jgi:hypothetical protein
MTCLCIVTRNQAKITSPLEAVAVGIELAQILCTQQHQKPLVDTSLTTVVHRVPRAFAHPFNPHA